jgi:abortive infection bacteriophage resistance protein
MSQPYHKGWLSYSDQVQLLQQRGLVVSDLRKAEQFLSHLNYYRFSGYCLAFESQRHTFVAGTRFEQIVDAYQFDLSLRDLVTEALEIIEVDLRAAIAYYFGQRYGAFGHTAATNFYAGFGHTDWLLRLQEEANRSSELFVTHFQHAYVEFPDLPVWMVTEVMSFGGLSKMFMGMSRPDQKSISSRYGLQPSILQSWMHHFVYVRNLCAHHSRLWDRVWAIKPTLPHGKDWATPNLRSNRHLLATLMLLRYWLKRIPAANRFAANWKNRVEQHLQSPPSVTSPDIRMGLTQSWMSNPIWK